MQAHQLSRLQCTILMWREIKRREEKRRVRTKTTTYGLMYTSFALCISRRVYVQKGQSLTRHCLMDRKKSWMEQELRYRRCSMHEIYVSNDLMLCLYGLDVEISNQYSYTKVRYIWMDVCSPSLSLSSFWRIQHTITTTTTNKNQMN